MKKTLAMTAVLALWALPPSTPARASDADADDDAVSDGAAVTYVPTTTTRSQKPIRWQNSNCVLVRPNSKGDAEITDGSDLEAIRRSVEHWHTAVSTCSYLQIELEEPSPDALPAYVDDGPNENVIHWVEEHWPHDPNAAGITTVFFVDDPDHPQDGRILDADIEINGRFRYSASGERSKTDIENTVVHELGHVMGLDHTCDDGARRPVPQDNTGETIPSCDPLVTLPPAITEATMFTKAAIGETKKRTPEEGDILGICETYPIAEDPGECVPADLEIESGGCAMDATPYTALGWLALLGVGLLARRRRRAER